MMSDLRNLKVLAWFLQKFELNFDILSSLKELSKQIRGEFDFRWATLFIKDGWCLIFHLFHLLRKRNVSRRLLSAPNFAAEHRIGRRFKRETGPPTSHFEPHKLYLVTACFGCQVGSEDNGSYARVARGALRTNKSAYEPLFHQEGPHHVLPGGMRQKTILRVVCRSFFCLVV